MTDAKSRKLQNYNILFSEQVKLIDCCQIKDKRGNIPTAFEADELPSRASSNFLFFLGPMAASAVELAARLRINSSSSC